MTATLKQRYYPFPPRNATGEKNLSKFRGLFVLCSTPPPPRFSFVKPPGSTQAVTTVRAGLGFLF